jgi:CubicO group peptidase (beta-lactamase class C family)
MHGATRFIAVLASCVLATTWTSACAPRAPEAPASVALPLESVTTIPPAPRETVATNSPRATPGGTTFLLPARWSMETHDSYVVLTGPEPDLRTAVFDSTEGTPDAAVNAAWGLFHPGFHRPILVEQQEASTHGWEESRLYTYEVSPDEKLIVLAVAKRVHDTWTVAVIETAVASFEKRIADLKLFGDAFFPKGYTKETFAGKPAHALDEARIKEITDFVDHARVAARVPGVAFALVGADRVFFQGGFGTRELGGSAKVDADTLFMIASDTKALTTLLLAKLVDEGKLDWDTPVTAVLPSFKLGDAETTSRVLVRHLVCACTGLPRQDLEWLLHFKGMTPAKELDILSTMKPTTGFGETFQYSNLLAAAGGYVAASVAHPGIELGAAYDEAMQTRIFRPLGMTSTTFDFGRALQGNHASPHEDDIDFHMRLVPIGIDRSIIPLRPAGGAWSNVRDMARYVRLELVKGVLPDGRRLVSEKNLLARRNGGVPLGQDATYGMGLAVDSGSGVPIVSHDGSLFGFKSKMFWLPEQGVGGIILTNAQTGGDIIDVVLRKTLEVLFDGRPEAEAQLRANVDSRAKGMEVGRKRLTMPPSADIVSKLAPAYTSPSLGRLTVRKEKDRVVFDFDDWKSIVATHRNEDGTDSVITVSPGVLWLEFVVAERDGKRTLVLHGAQQDYEWVEAGP